MPSTRHSSHALHSSRRARTILHRAILETLELRRFLSAAHDLVGITDLRADPNFTGIDGSGITIALLDSGVYADNPALSGNFLGYINAVSPANGILTLDTNPADADADANASGDGHGTHTAGIAASTDPDIGAATGASFIEIRNMPLPGEIPTVSGPFHAPLQWILSHAQQYHIKVVNISQGNPDVNSDDPVAAARHRAVLAADIHALEDHGIAVVISSGNNYAQYADGTSKEIGNSTPAVFSKIAVGNSIADTVDPSFLYSLIGEGPDYFALETALGAPDQIEASSQRSDLPSQIFAPGDNITSTWLGNATKTESGTSMSAPLVAGIVALMQQEAHSISGTYLSVDQIVSILHSTADTINDSSIAANFRVSRKTGGKVVLPTTGLQFKRVNAHRALQAVRTLFTSPLGQQFTPITGPIQQLPALNGTEAFDAFGNIGKDGDTSVGPDNVDLYQVNILETANFTLYLTLPDGGTPFSGTLRVFNSSGQEVRHISGAVNDTEFLTLQTDPANPLALGTYYIGVSSAGNDSYDPVSGTGAAGGSSTGDYRLNVNIVNPDPNGVTTGAVPTDLADPLFFVDSTTPFNDQTHHVGVFGDGGFLGSDPPVDGSFDTARVSVDNGDVDMFQVIAPDDGVLVVQVDATPPDGAQFSNAYIRVFQLNDDGSITQVISSTQPGSDTSALVQFHTQVGRSYYIGISTFNNQQYDAINPYGRPVNSTPHDAPLEYDLSMIFDNGDKDGTVFTAATRNIGTSFHEAIGADNNFYLLDTGPSTATSYLTKDVDWSKFDVPSDGVFDLHVTQALGIHADLSLWLYDPDTETATRLGDSAGTSEILYQAHAGQSVYAAITDLNNGDFNWSAVATGSGGNVGVYTVASRLLGNSALKTLSNNSIQNGTPTPISPGKTLDANIGSDGALIIGSTDVDLYSFRAPSTGYIILSTLTQNESDADTVIRVFDSAGNEIANSQSNTFNDLGGLISVNVLAGHTYYIGISGASAQAGNYSALDGSGAASGSSGHYRLTLSMPTHLVFSRQPSATVAGNTIAPVTVKVVDAAGHVVTSDLSTITISIFKGPNGASLQGTLSADVQNGVATFNDLSVTVAGFFNLGATNGSLPLAGSATFTILPESSSSRLISGAEPASSVVGKPISPPVIFFVVDQYGNRVTADHSSVTVSIISGPGATFSGTTTIPVIRGVATFKNLALSQVGSYSLRAQDLKLAIVTPVDFPMDIVQGVTTIIPPAVAASYAFGKSVKLAVVLKSAVPASFPFSAPALLFDDTNQLVATATANAAGTVSLLFTNLSPGDHLFTLAYPGDTNHTAATSSTFTIHILAAPI